MVHQVRSCTIRQYVVFDNKILTIVLIQVVSTLLVDDVRMN